MCVSPFSSVDLQVVEVVQRGAQSPACLHVVHFLGQLQHSALLESEPILEQTGDVGHVHTQERTDGRVLGHLIAHLFSSLLEVSDRQRSSLDPIDKACFHRSVKVIGEGIENIAVFELIRLMNNPLHHLKYFLITKLVSCITIWVPAHLIGQPAKAPFIPELLWQAGTFKNSPLQPCGSTDVTLLIF